METTMPLPDELISPYFDLTQTFNQGEAQDLTGKSSKWTNITIPLKYTGITFIQISLQVMTVIGNIVPTLACIE
jgi:hypothetical protein